MRRTIFAMGILVICVTAMTINVGCEESVQSEDEGGLFSGQSEGQEEIIQKYRKAAKKIVTQGLRDKDGVIRANAIETVKQARLYDLLGMVEKMLLDGSVAVRFAAAVAIGDMGHTAGRYKLQSALEDNDNNVKMAAAYALTKLGIDDLTEKIIFYSRSSDPTVQANAILLLGKLGNQQALPVVMGVLYNDESPDKVKIQGMLSVARLGNEDYIYQRLWSLLISKHPDDRVMGIRGMGAMGTVESRDAIVTMLDDDLWEVKLTAADELGKLGYMTGRPELLDYLGNESRGAGDDSFANYIATMAIGSVGGDEVAEYLPKRLLSRSKRIRLVAAQALLVLSKQGKAEKNVG